MLRKGNELASEIDFTIPHCVNTIEEAVAIIRENRAAWLAAQKETQIQPDFSEVLR
jgi:copper chaperone CopZ